jgi:PBSX family phage terminase large subunit
MRKTTLDMHPGQTRAWKSDRRFVSIIAGTGGGKTFFGPIWLYREIQRHPGDDFLVVAPTFGLLQRVTFPACMRLLERLLPGIREKYRAMERALELPGGGRLFFGSADRPMSLEGVHVRAAWLDEAGQMKREAWEVAQRRVGHKKGRILITTTPYNIGWLKVEVYDRFKAGNPDHDVITFPSLANPSYPPEEYERARRTLPDWKFRMFYQGQFTRASGLVYQDFDQGKHLIDPFPIPTDWRRVLGVDFGFNNPTAAVWLAIDHDNRAYSYREYYRRERLPQESGNDLLFLSEGEGIECAYADPSDPSAIEEYNRLGLPARPADNDVLAGITSVVSAIRAGQLYIFKGLVNILDEMENYRWMESNGDIKDRPVKEYDHLMDALRYAVVGLRPKQAPCEIGDEPAMNECSIPIIWQGEMPVFSGSANAQNLLNPY